MRTERRDGLVLHHFDLAATGPAPGVLASVTGREGGVSAPPRHSLNLSFGVGDDPRSVLENRRRLVAALGVDLAALTVGAQVHGDRVAVIGDAERGRGAGDAASAIPDVDALVTDRDDVVLGVLTADCVPVVLVDATTGVVAVAHAGWRGTVAGVVTRTVATMVERFGTDPADVVAGLGPSIGPASYEVGPEVVAAARAGGLDAAVVGERADGHAHLDLWAANAALLVAAGVPRGAVEVCGLDTASRGDAFFSHRTQAPTGRFMAVAGLLAAR